ncbi:hypothetical protein ZWY2020_022658 [Hordeum vulgare]|nr:hypothetical protein ZWY2020_022658 [Hordeum vulgare]
MEKQPGSWRGSNAGHEERLPLRSGGAGGLETETRAPHADAADQQQEAGRGRHRRNCVRAALVLCLLTLPACMLVVWNLRAGSSSRMLFDVGNLPKHDGDDQDIRDDMSDELSPSAQIDYDRLLGGLLIEGFDERSCRSRYQFARYQRNAARVPSPYLIERLRRQEALQKKCGPGTKSYNNAAKQLMSTQSINGTSDCNYLFLIIHAGMGNRMLEITSAFLYALLTGRVLLVDRYKQIASTFCEPFPGTSWLIPSDFPLCYNEFNEHSPESYGNMVQDNVIRGNTYPPFVYLHLDGDYAFHDKLFYCQDDQQFLQGVPWLIMRTDMYFVPSLFLIPSFQDELSKLFPEKDTVFHHLGRYLLHPTNDIWYSATTYYRAYLARADKGEKLLPQIGVTTHEAAAGNNNRTVAVLATSLSSWYGDQIRERYGEHRTVDGTTVKVYQPSHEEYQKKKNRKHDMKALAEIYLLSMSDVLITSGFSTFGYVAQGLAGLTPWIMYRPENHVVPEPPCGRAMSIEPCFHQAPYYDCKAKRDADLAKVVPYVRHCEDVSWGLKIVNETRL